MRRYHTLTGKISHSCPTEKDLNEVKHIVTEKKTKSKVLQLLEILSLSDVIMSDIENTFGRLGTFGNCKAQID